MHYIKALNGTHLKSLISSEIAVNGKNCDLNHIDVSNINDISYMFMDVDFNGDISQWNTSNVTKMDGLFIRSKFNGNISKWDVSRLESAKYMFNQSNFNGYISNWNTFHLKHAEHMFTHSPFCGDLSKWNIDNLEWDGPIFNFRKTHVPSKIIFVDSLCRKQIPKININNSIFDKYIKLSEHMNIEEEALINMMWSEYIGHKNFNVPEFYSFQ